MSTPLNLRRIATNVESISRSFGRPIALEGYNRHSFPPPQRLAEAGEKRLRQLGLGFRARYVASVASVVAEGGLDLLALRKARYEQAYKSLTVLPGVGDKVANCVLLFSLDKLEAFPVDVWVRRALQEWYLDGTDRGLSNRQMREWAQGHFGSNAGYANQYLFHTRRLHGIG